MSMVAHLTFDLSNYRVQWVLCGNPFWPKGTFQISDNLAQSPKRKRIAPNELHWAWRRADLFPSHFILTVSVSVMTFPRLCALERNIVLTFQHRLIRCWAFLRKTGWWENESYYMAAVLCHCQKAAERKIMEGWNEIKSQRGSVI